MKANESQYYIALKQQISKGLLKMELASEAYQSWWMYLMLPVQMQGWKSGFSGTASDRHTRQMSVEVGG